LGWSKRCAVDNKNGGRNQGEARSNDSRNQKEEITKKKGNTGIRVIFYGKGERKMSGYPGEKDLKLPGQNPKKELGERGENYSMNGPEQTSQSELFRHLRKSLELASGDPW